MNGTTDPIQRSWKLLSLLCMLVACPCYGQLVPGTAPDMPVRGIGINEGLADLPGYSLGQATTATAANIAARGYHVVKIWPKFQWPLALEPIFADPLLQVIIYRPLHLSQATTACGLTAYVWEDVDYGQIANRLYQLYGHHEKIVILTGWEADNQIDFLPRENPTCSWPAQSQVNAFKAMLDARQTGVRQARESNVGAKLRVYHAVEVRQVPSAPSGNLNVLEQIIPNMIEPPDLISYSAWGTPPSSVAAKLNTIAAVSGLPRHRIFIGEWGCRTDSANRAACFRDHANNSFQWGVRLWNAWSYSESGTSSGYDLINGKHAEEISDSRAMRNPCDGQGHSCERDSGGRHESGERAGLSGEHSAPGYERRQRFAGSSGASRICDLNPRGPGRRGCSGHVRINRASARHPGRDWVFRFLTFLPVTP